MDPADVATAVHIVGQVATSPRNGGSIAGWVEVALTSLIGLAVAYLVYRPKMTKVENDRLDSLDGARANDMIEMRKDLHDMRSLVGTLTGRVNASDLRVGQLEFALRISMDEIERLAPEGNTIAKQLRNYLGAVAPLPSGITQEQMELLRGIKG